MLFPATPSCEYILISKVVKRGRCVCPCVCVSVCWTLVHLCWVVRSPVVNVICSGRESMSNSVRVTKRFRVTLCPLSTHFRSPSSPQWPAGSLWSWTTQAYWYIRWDQGSHVGSVLLSVIAAPPRICNYKVTSWGNGLGRGSCHLAKLSVLEFSFLADEMSEEGT